MQLTASCYKTDGSFLGSFIITQTVRYNPEYGTQETGFGWQLVLAGNAGTIGGSMGNANAAGRIDLYSASGQNSGAFEGFMMPMNSGQAFTFVHPRGVRLRCVVSSFEANSGAKPATLAAQNGAATARFMAGA